MQIVNVMYRSKLKNMFKNNFFKKRKQIKHYTRFFKSFFKSGLYFLEFNDEKTFIFKKIKIFDIKKFLKIKNIYFFKGKGILNSFVIKFGTEKINLIANKVIISKYIDKSISLETLNSKINFCLPKLQLPHNIYMKFDFNERCIIVPFVDGTVINDSYHNNIFINKLFNSSLKSEIFKIDYNKHKILFYIQHEDAYGSNVLWKNDDFVLIDNEGVNLYPAFYDAFLSISTLSNNSQEFYDHIKKNFHYIHNLAKNNAVIADEKFIDEYLSFFVYFRFKCYAKSKKRVDNHRPFLFLNDNNSKVLFPKTYQLFRKLCLGQNVFF